MSAVSILLFGKCKDDKIVNPFLFLLGKVANGLFFVLKISTNPKNALVLLIMVFSFLPWTLITAQESQARQELRENIHLHLNKTIFFQGESLWLTAYIQDEVIKLPSHQTSDVHVALYDLKGNVIKHKTLYAEKGIATGDFEIDSTFIDRAYSIVAWTNYMRNFPMLRPFHQIIHIIQNKAPEMEEEQSPQITIYPEGGKLIAGVYNQIAFRLEDAIGVGILQNHMVLVNEEGTILQSRLGTNGEGYGRIGLLVEPGKKYFMRYTDANENSIISELPDPIENELGIQIDNNLEDKILFKLMAADSLFKIKKGQKYTLAVFQDDDLLLEDMILREEQQTFALARSTLPYGLNTAVLLNADLVPIAHRMFFNHRQDANRHISSLNIEHTLQKDSLILHFSLPKKVAQEAFISISTLPGDSRSSYPENSIASSFLLSPYVTKNASLSYYFKENNRNRRFELDTHLILEGKGLYDWESRKDESLEIRFAMENGVLIKGKVTDADLSEEKQVYLISDQTKAVAFQDLNTDKSFELYMNLFEGDSLAIALIGNKGKLRKAKVEVQLEYNNQPLPFNMLHDTIKHNNTNSKRISTPASDILKSDVSDATIVLEEAIVTESYKYKKNMLLSPNVELNFIDDEDIKRSPSLAAYLRRLGLKVFVQEGDIVVQSFQYPYPIFSLSVNGMEANPGELMDIPLSRVQSVVVGNNVQGYSFMAANFISIQMRPGFYVSPENRSQYIKYIISNGYAPSRTYSNPGYANYADVLFSEYGVLDWKSSLGISNLEPTSIKIPIHGQEKVQLYIEGMSSNGSLISFSKEITLKP